VTETVPFKILLVEDNPGDVELTREALRDTGVPLCLQVASDGVEALLVLLAKDGENARRPDLIILDINLPKKSGLEVLAEIKSDPALRQIPVLMLSCSAADRDVFKSYDLHANCYVRKPENLDGFDKIFEAISDFWMGVAKLPPR
jgi:CheY-like chemotaxis protein